MARRAPHRQTTLDFRPRGGSRPGAGRKPNGARAMVSHVPRPSVCPRDPVLVTLKMRRHVWNLRARRALARLMSGLAAAKERNGMRIVHYSVQRDHVHLMVEALDRAALSRGVQGLCVRFARALNRLMERKGKVFADRFHSRVLATPRQTRNALAYVLCNARKHGVAPAARGWLDPCSSASAFDGWRGVVALERAPVVEPRSWLLRIGWRRHGLLHTEHHPGTIPD